MTYLANTIQRQGILHFIPTHFTSISLIFTSWTDIFTLFLFLLHNKQYYLQIFKKRSRLHIIFDSYPIIIGDLITDWSKILIQQSSLVGSQCEISKIQYSVIRDFMSAITFTREEHHLTNSREFIRPILFFCYRYF